MEQLVRRGLAAGLGHEPEPQILDTALADFDRCYRDHLFVASRVYPGVADTLERLRAADVRLACVTNKRARYANALLRQCGILPLIDCVVGGDTFTTRKPDPAPLLGAARLCAVDPREAAMIGDSINDRDAARAAGFAFIFAAYGYAEPDDPALNQGNAAIRSFTELPALLCA